MKKAIHLYTAFAICITLTVGCGKDDPVNPANNEPLVTLVGTPIGGTVTASIDASGGSLSSADGILQLIVPSGAVSTATIFSIQPISNYCPGGTGMAYRLLPEGITFAQPVSIIFSYTDTLPGNENFLKIAYQDDDRTWFAPRAVSLNVTNNNISVQVKHFSDWSLFLKLVIEPSTPSVKINESVVLKVTFVGELNTITNSEGSELNNLNIDPNVSTTWQAAAGAIEKQGDDRANYTAPSAVPSPNPVEVSVMFNNVSFTFHGQTFTNPKLNAYINVFGDLAYFDVVFTSSRSLQPVGSSWFTETDWGRMKVLVQGDSVIVYDIRNQNAELLPGSLYDDGPECTHTVISPGDGPYHVSDGITFGGIYTPFNNQVYIGVSSQNISFGLIPEFQISCTGSSPTTTGGESLPTAPTSFSFDAGKDYQENMQIIPGGGFFPDGFLKTAVTRTR